MNHKYIYRTIFHRPFFAFPVLLKVTSFLVLAVVASVFMACGDDPASSEEDDPTAELVLEGQVAEYDQGEQRVWAGPSLAEGSLDADGSFTVTLLGLEDIEDDLGTADPEASGFDRFRGFACEEEAHDAVGSDVGFAMITGFAFDAEDLTHFGLASQSVDRVRPLPLEEGVHVRWIFAEEAVTIDAECRDGDREMNLDLSAGWNEVIIETDRPKNTWFHEQYTGERPSTVEWMLKE